MHDTDDALFRAVHGVAGRFAGQPVPVVMEALLRHLPKAPGIEVTDIRKIAEEISVGRDPSGL
ncbi:unnamed protein product [[Actinomadura] parvosata subsp. kistnae]|uniref:HPt domain-containing protein n=2 Tax=Nonomuraea TaxID=83681 RepID=A0A1V0ABG4_9ACTN|nr:MULTISPECIES: hypothetical protein [unclassified Nonomuraea]AQZ67545.1 hypothetical protein BKM31_44220 [Nonomuraea sp. ATCC 55076]NJP91158.1 hypothetical protein [Nonomuraea sp. FMUSA5-5]SPL94183.1 unnamed protein product [Actinomadura parvosata subsp. kistnae]